MRRVDEYLKNDEKMKLLKHTLICLLAFLAIVSCTKEPQFVTVENGRFMVGGKPYSYVGANFWYGAILGSQGEGGDRDRLLRELDILCANGIGNLRILVGGDGPDGVPSRIEPTLQKAPGQYNDAILDGLDFLLAEMRKRDMKAVLYLNNSWEWSGGYSQYLEWAGAGKAPIPAVDGWEPFMQYVAQYAQNPAAQKLFSNYVRDMVTRTNRYTGVRYAEDPTIMAWQIGNEPRSFNPDNATAFLGWMSEISALIKRLDPNHLVSTGSEGQMGCEGDLTVVERLHADPNVDYMTIHIWPFNWGWVTAEELGGVRLDTAIANTRTYIDAHLDIARRIGKPLVLEEFGFPRDGFAFTPGSPVSCRDRYYEAVFSYVLENRMEGGPFAGCNFWSWGGVARPATDHQYWQRGDDYTGDPAQEQQGLNSVFAADSTTLAIVSRYAALLAE